MTKAEKNYKRDYGHKDSAELALNYTRDGMREELDGVLEKVSPDELTADEQEYLNGRDQCRNHTLNIRFNDTEWEHICRQAELLHVKKSSYVRECAKAHYVLMMDQSDMNGIIGAVRALSTNVNQIARRANKTSRIYSEDITTTKESVNAIWQLLSYIVIKDSDDFADFLLKCAQNGILVYYDPEHTIDLKFMLAEQKERNPRAKMTRAKTLGWFYETEQIKSRIIHYKKAMEKKPRALIRRVPVQAEENKFIRDSIDRTNMKLTSKAMNILAKYGVTAEEAKAESIAAFSERVALVQELNDISDEIKELEERAETLRKFWAFKPYYDEYKSLSGRKQEKYKKAQKNARYKAIKLKADELSQAANEIEQYLRQEQSRERRKRKIGVCLNNRLSDERSVNTEMFP